MQSYTQGIGPLGTSTSENAQAFLADMDQLNQLGYAFMGLGVVIAILSFFLYRKLRR